MNLPPCQRQLLIFWMYMQMAKQTKFDLLQPLQMINIWNHMSKNRILLVKRWKPNINKKKIAPRFKKWKVTIKKGNKILLSYLGSITTSFDLPTKIVTMLRVLKHWFKMSVIMWWTFDSLYTNAKDKKGARIAVTSPIIHICKNNLDSKSLRIKRRKLVSNSHM